MLQKTLIECCHILRGSTVNEHGIEDVHIQYVFAELLRRTGCRLSQRLPVVGQVDAVAVEDSIP